MLGKPRANLQEQIRDLQYARDWLYELHLCNVVQRELKQGDQVIGWELMPNLAHPARKQIRAWLTRRTLRDIVRERTRSGEIHAARTAR